METEPGTTTTPSGVADVVQAYRFVLDLNPTRLAAVRSHAGAARFAYNWALARIKAIADQREAELSYGIPEELLTPYPGWSLPALRREWNRVKDVVAPWWREVSKEAFNTGLSRISRALDSWHKSKTGRRKGRRVGFPRFKSKDRATPSVAFTTGAIRIEPDRKHIVLPRLGRLKLHESARKLARRIEAGSARIMSATVRSHRGRWQVTFTCTVTRTITRAARRGGTVGVDLGIKHLAVLSTGEKIANPKHLDQALAILRRLGRSLSRKQGPDRRAGQRASGRWKRASVKLAKAHHRVANLRENALHPLTTRLATQFSAIVVEDLNVAGMLRNRRLARRIADASFGELRRQVEYKTSWYGSHLVIADRWYPSSKTCSGCGEVKTKLSLSERRYHCEHCGLIIDRDVNAALNLAALVDEVQVDLSDAGSGPVEGRGADRKTRVSGRVAVKRQPTPDQTPVPV